VTSQEAIFVVQIGIDILFKIMDELDQARDLVLLGSTSNHFRTGMKKWLKSNTYKFATAHGIEFPEWLFKAIERNNSIVSGPDVLRVWMANCPQTNRLEIYSPNDPASYTRIIDHLSDTEGFEVQQVFDQSGGHTFKEVYQDFEFGKTVQAVVGLKKTDKGTERVYDCIVVISKSPDTAVVTVTELMSTLFMNFITGTAVVSLYPSYTFYREGLINYDGPVTAESMEVTKTFKEGGMTMKNSVGIEHKCGNHQLCPNTIRHFTDNRAYCVNLANLNAAANVPAIPAKPLVYWRLRCGGMCGEGIPEAYQTESIAVIYGTHRYTCSEYMPTRPNETY
jgi:hypothetical protein